MANTADTTADTTADKGEVTDGKQEQDKAPAFTQADIDAAAAKARNEERRKLAAKTADYDELKRKADAAKTVEDRLAEMEQRAAQAEALALRNDVATQFNISAEDRDLFLTGTDVDTLTAQAKRLAERDAVRKKNGNTVPGEGRTPSGSTGDLREFTRQLFGSATTS